jgi:glutamate mutase epsilon subunit
MTADKASNREKALIAWGADAPRYILLLADACDRTSQRRVAEQTKRSSAQISKIINRAYEASYAEIEKVVLSLFSADNVDCPIVDAPIALKDCLRSRRFDGPSINPLHRQWRLHCPNCPNNLDGDRK